MKYLNLSILFLSLALTVNGFQSSFFLEANTFFKDNVKNGAVNYEAIHKNQKELNSLRNQIKSVNLETMDEKQEKAFFINTYNILTIYSIVENYPIKSVMDIPGFFTEIKHIVGGKKLSLDEIEKGILMKKHFDPNLHFVLVCGAESCPPLASFAFTPENVEQKIKERTIFTLNDPNFIQRKGGVYNVSKIFEWYSSDFTKISRDVASFINQYRKEKIPINSRLTYYEYSWNLND